MTAYFRHAFGNPIELLFRLVLAGVFVWAGLLKAIDPLGMADTVRNYQIIGDPWVIWVAVCLPWLEILCGVAILFRVLYDGALFLTGAMLVGFMGAIVSVWVRGLDIDCGCFGSTGRASSYPVVLLQDAGLLLAVIGLAWARRREGDREAAGGGTDLIDKGSGSSKQFP